KKRQDTLDLMVVGFEEAIDKHGFPKGMVGRIQIMYKGKQIGAGPGKLSHVERTKYWDIYKKGLFLPQLAEIAYKPDPSYDALREARFQCWRSDKTQPDET
ncbi:MAG: hypothetical protein GY852_05520, partial [bacterium]|nr:hypothetical protein [bacterium]